MLKRIVTLFRCLLYVIRPTSARSYNIACDVLMHVTDDDDIMDLYESTRCICWM